MISQKMIWATFFHLGCDLKYFTSQRFYILAPGYEIYLTDSDFILSLGLFLYESEEH